MTESVKAILNAGNVPVDWEQINTSGINAGREDAQQLLQASIKSLRRNKVGLKGKCSDRVTEMASEDLRPQEPSIPHHSCQAPDP